MKKATSILLTFFMLFNLFDVISVRAIEAARDNAAISSGSNETETQFLTRLITNSDELSAIRHDLSAHYQLANDIDLEGINWEPIGNQAQPFMGTFDGNGNSIRNLDIQTSGECIGLFGVIKGGTVKNITFENVSINAPEALAVGTIAGMANSAVIDNCYVKSGTVYGCAEGLGGLIGIFEGVMSNSGFTGNIDHLHSDGDKSSRFVPRNPYNEIPMPTEADTGAEPTAPPVDKNNNKKPSVPADNSPKATATPKPANNSGENSNNSAAADSGEDIISPGTEANLADSDITTEQHEGPNSEAPDSSEVSVSDDNSSRPGLQNAGNKIPGLATDFIEDKKTDSLKNDNNLDNTDISLYEDVVDRIVEIDPVNPVGPPAGEIVDFDGIIDSAEPIEPEQSSNANAGGYVLDDGLVPLANIGGEDEEIIDLVSPDSKRTVKAEYESQDELFEGTPIKSVPRAVCASRSGGLVGHASGKITKSYANVTGQNLSSGLVGYASGYIDIIQCFSAGEAWSGLIGTCNYLSKMHISDSFSLIDSDLVTDAASLEIKNCYSLKKLSGSSFDSKVLRCFSSADFANSSSSMKESSTYAGWDFDNIWNILPGFSYPFLQALPFPFAEIVDIDDDSVINHSGSVDGISQDFYVFRAHSLPTSNGYMEFKADFSLSDTKFDTSMTVYNSDLVIVKDINGNDVKSVLSAKISLENDEEYYVAIKSTSPDSYEFSLNPDYDRYRGSTVLDFNDPESAKQLSKMYLYNGVQASETTTGKFVSSYKIEVEDASDFKAGQGIALEGLLRISDYPDGSPQYTWFTSTIVSIKGNIISIGHAIPESSQINREFKVYHDNWYPLISLRNLQDTDISIIFEKDAVYEVRGTNVYVPPATTGKSTNTVYTNPKNTVSSGIGYSALIELADKNSIYLDFNNSTISYVTDFYMGADFYYDSSMRYYSFVRPYRIIKFSNCQNVTIKNLNIDSTMEENFSTNLDLHQGYGTGIIIIGCSKVSLYNLNIRHMDQDALQFIQYKNSNPIKCSTDVRIKNLYAFRNGRQGISANNLDGFKLTDSSFVETGKAKIGGSGEYIGYLPGSGIDFEVESSVGGGLMSNILVKNCNFVDNIGRQINWCITGLPTKSENVIMEDNIFYNSDPECDEEPVIGFGYSRDGYGGILFKNNLVVVKPRTGAHSEPRTTILQSYIDENSNINPSRIFENNVFLGEIGILSYSCSKSPETGVNRMVQYTNNKFLCESESSFRAIYYWSYREYPFANEFTGNFFYFTPESINRNPAPFGMGNYFTDKNGQKNTIFNAHPSKSLKLNMFGENLIMEMKTNYNNQFSVYNKTKFFGMYDISNINMNGFTAPDATRQSSFEMSSAAIASVTKGLLSQITGLNTIPSEAASCKVLYEKAKSDALAELSALTTKLEAYGYVMTQY